MMPRVTHCRRMIPRWWSCRCFILMPRSSRYLLPRLSGGKLVIAPKFSASGFWPTIETNHVTWVSVVPTIISILLMNQQALAAYHSNIHLRFVRSSSFALPEDKLVAFQSHFHTQVLEGYGMTETASQSTLNPIHAPKIGSAGKPVGTELRTN